MSKIEVNAVEPQCGTTLTLGASGDTVTIPSGATISNLGTAAGFGSTGEVSWDTTKKTTGFTAVSGVGYFCDTTSAAFTVTLPATPSAGNVVAVSDYAGTFNTNTLTIDRNGSNINGSASNFIIGQKNVTAQFIYVDATQGWRVVFTGSQTGEGLLEDFVCATGGTITTCGNDKIHTFTSPGTFTVNSIADSSTNNVVSYVVVAGGGGGDYGGGGAGGFREYKSPVTPYTASPLDGNPGGTEITVTATSFPITIGGGGGGNTQGSNSIFSTVTSTGGGAGSPFPADGGPGGSGGGGGGGPNPGSGANVGGSGNTPPVSPPQGNPGGSGYHLCGSHASGGGGGGATQAGIPKAPGPKPATPFGNGGAGATTSINGTPTAYAGGGGAGAFYCSPGTGGTGGGSPGNGNGTVNTGGGGGGPGSGGSGIVIIRYKYQ
jgi:hypothetical protein